MDSSVGSSVGTSVGWSVGDGLGVDPDPADDPGVERGVDPGFELGEEPDAVDTGDGASASGDGSPPQPARSTLVTMPARADRTILVRDASVGTAVPQHGLDGADQDVEIETQRPVVDVLQVQPDRLRPAEVRAT